MNPPFLLWQMKLLAASQISSILKSHHIISSNCFCFPFGFSPEFSLKVSVSMLFCKPAHFHHTRGLYTELVEIRPKNYAKKWFKKCSFLQISGAFLLKTRSFLLKNAKKSQKMHVFFLPTLPNRYNLTP